MAFRLRMIRTGRRFSSCAAHSDATSCSRLQQLEQLLPLNSVKCMVQHDLRVTTRHAACIRCGGILSRCIRYLESGRIMARATNCIRVQQYRNMGIVRRLNLILVKTVPVDEPAAIPGSPTSIETAHHISKIYLDL